MFFLYVTQIMKGIWMQNICIALSSAWFGSFESTE